MSGRAEDLTQALERWGVITVVTPWPSGAVVCGCLLKNYPKFRAVLIGWSGLCSCDKEEVLQLPYSSPLHAFMPVGKACPQTLPFNLDMLGGSTGDRLAAKVLIFSVIPWAECQRLRPLVFV